MDTLPIGLGLYVDTNLTELQANFGPVIDGTPIVLMCGTDANERHDMALSLTNSGRDVTRRRLKPDNAQVDMTQTPEWNAANWRGYILGGLNPSDWKRHYRRAVGPNEWIPDDAAMYEYACAFEVALCERLHADGIEYAWGSIASGNIDPVPFATAFEKINAIADAVCYHGYIKPHATTLEPETEPYWAWRPWMWYQEVQKRGGRIPAVLFGESGTYFPWTSMGLGQDAYQAILGEIAGLLAVLRSRGMTIIGQMAFSYGAEGAMGKAWNLDSQGIRLLATFNATAHDTRIDSTPGGKTMPNVGQGFQKCVPFIGNYIENEIYHAAGTPNETSVALAEHGYATYRKATNQTVATCDDGRVYDDLGNHGDGHMVEIRGPFQ